MNMEKMNEVYKEMLMYYGRKEMNRAFEVK